MEKKSKRGQYSRLETKPKQTQLGMDGVSKFSVLFSFSFAKRGHLNTQWSSAVGVGIKKHHQDSKDRGVRKVLRRNFLHFLNKFSDAIRFVLAAQFKRFPWISLEICCRRNLQAKLLKIHKTKGWRRNGNGRKSGGKAGESATAALELIVDI